MCVSLKIGISIPNLLNNPLAFCSYRNFNFLLLHTEQFDKRIILPSLVLTTFGFLFSVFFLHFKQQENIFHNYRFTFYLLLDFFFPASS